MKKLMIALVAVGMTSCVPQKKYDDLERSYYQSLDEQAAVTRKLTLADHSIETLSRELKTTKEELFVKDTALANVQKLMNVSQSEFDNLMQEMHLALNSSSEKTKTFFNQLTDKEKQTEDLIKKIKELEAKVETQNAEIIKLKREAFIQNIQEQVK